MDHNNIDSPKDNDLEKDIEKSIQEIKNRDKRPWPEKKYMEINNKKITPLSTLKAESAKRERKDHITIILLSLIACLFIIISSILLIQNSASINRNATKKISEKAVGTQIINNIRFSANNIKRQGTNVTVNVSIENQSKNNFYITVHSISLVDEKGKEYFPALDKGNISPNFFGQKILPSSNKKAEIMFTSIPENSNNLTLIINNVSDVYHFTWDYMITLP